MGFMPLRGMGDTVIQSVISRCESVSSIGKRLRETRWRPIDCLADKKRLIFLHVHEARQQAAV